MTVTPRVEKSDPAKPAPQSKGCFIKTYGCQMNVYDSERMAEAMTQAGYHLVEAAEQADLIILNTCHIREKAAEKVYSELGRLKPLKTRNQDVIFAVAGCVAQAEGAEIIARAPSVDLVFGPQTYHDLPNMLDEVNVARHRGERPRLVRTEFPAEEKFEALHSLPRQPITRLPTAFVTIQEGCDKFCTFCVVPYTRGAEVSRAADEIVAEAQALVASGVCEITLLGQNVNAWQDRQSGAGLAALLERLSDIAGLARLRFTTSHPKDMDEALIAAHGRLDALMPYLHLPVQAGSDRILKAMNRHHTAAFYEELIARFRAARPDLAVSSDFIVGFPGETDDDFDATMALVDRVQYAQAFSFKYSPRPGTPAADLPQIEEAVKDRRLAALQELLNAQQRAFNGAQIDRVLPVLFERKGRQAGQITGRSPYLQPVHVAADETVIGRILPVRITAAHANSLSGILVD